MCDKIDIPRGKGRATDKMLYDANKGSRDFYKKNSNLITKLKTNLKIVIQMILYIQNQVE